MASGCLIMMGARARPAAPVAPLPLDCATPSSHAAQLEDWNFQTCDINAAAICQPLPLLHPVGPNERCRLTEI